MAELKPYVRPNYFEVAGNHQQADPPHQSSMLDQLINHESAVTIVKLDIDADLARESIFDENVLVALGKKTNCRIEWRNDALKVWSDAREDLQAAVADIRTFQSNKVYCHFQIQRFCVVLTIQIGSASRRQIYNLFSSLVLPGHKFRFSFSTSVVDQALLKTDESFAMQHYDLRSVVWDTKSLQFLSVLGETSPIKYPKSVKNIWSEPSIFAHGPDSANPKYWTNEDNVSQRNLTGRLSPTQISRVTNWAQEVDDARASEDPFSIFKMDVPRAQEATRQPRRGQIEIVESRKTRPLLKQPDLLTRQFMDTGAAASERLLIDPPNQDESSVHDTLKPIDVNDGRTKGQRSMPLRAAANLSKERPPKVDIASLVHKTIAEILASLELSGCLPAAVEIQFGQIFTKAISVPRRFRCSKDRPSEPFAREEWGLVYIGPSGNGKADTIFSPKITGAWEDAYFMVNLVHPNRKHMFSSTPTSDISTYRLLCLNERTGDQAFVEISNNTSSVRIKPKLNEIGATNIHFPRQVWDARVAVVGEAGLGQEESQPLRSIADNLWIHAIDNAKPGLERLYSKKVEPYVSIISAELRREMVYKARATGKDIAIHLTRVESLRIAELPGGFCAFSAKEEASSQSKELWEAKLTSAELNKFFNIKPDSDVKGIEHWLKSEPLREALHSLLNCADLVLRDIDDVGHSSRKKTSLSRSATKGSTRKAQSATSILARKLTDK